MIFTLPPLPYAMDALEPHVSARTLACHYQNHHGEYLRRLNSAVKSGPNARKTLDQLVLTAGDADVFNLAAQAWNHGFYWNGLSPQGGGEPPAALEEVLSDQFGSVHAFKEQLATAADAVFGSGWVWLIESREGHLAIDTSHNAGNPMTDDNIPLWVVDVWEHAYYLDYQHDRGRYIENILEYLINWRFIEQNLQATYRAGSPVPEAG